jgi:signal transduction histidine kinase
MSTSPQRLSVADAEDAALEALFQRGVKNRLYIAPFVFLAAISIIAWDPAAWRLWAVVAAIAIAGIRLIVEAIATRSRGLTRTRLSTLLPVPATILLVVFVTTGAVDSPIVVMLPLVTVFLCLFLRPLYGFVFASVATVCVWILASVQYAGIVDTMMPEVFGGGARSSTSNALLFTRATFETIGVFWAALAGTVIRSAFQDAIRRALHARDEVLVSNEESTRQLTTLVAEIAHELKNPLASVKGLAALVDREAQGKEKERLTVLRREVDRMQEILESFLNFSRPVVPLDVGEVRLGELVTQVAALHEGVAQERGVEIRIDAKAELAVKADARKVKQIVINLVQNALDVTPSGAAVDVVVGAGKILVMDRGPGVKDLERVFEPGVTSKERGNGLGLTIARLLARQHGGEVRLMKRDGGGIVAEVVLPLTPALSPLTQGEGVRT